MNLNIKARIVKWPLAFKLWGAFAASTLLVFALLAILLPWTLKGFFTDQLYTMLLDTQNGLHMEAATAASPLSVTINRAVDGTMMETTAAPPILMAAPIEPSFSASDTVSVRAVPGKTMALGVLSTRMTGPGIQHFTLPAESESDTPNAATPQPLVQAIEEVAYAQKTDVATYTSKIDNNTIFYAIRKEAVQGKTNYLVSYASGSYRNDLVMQMFYRLIILMVGIIVISWLPCLLIAKYFTRPLVQMERHVRRMAERNWHEPIETKREDEFGLLAKAIETMRQCLVRQDRAQQFFLQHTSHELKTPVMVIRSYAQSIQDGIFPKGSLNASIGVILKEGERLEKRIRDLLLLNKLNYLAAKEMPFRPIDLHTLIEDIVERLRYRRAELEWKLDLAPTIVSGDQEQWKIALENMIDNQLRYAKTYIQISVRPTDESSAKTEAGPFAHLEISNDGPPFDEEIADSLFEPFRTGSDGNFGLGLTIVKQIMDHHGMTVSAVNIENGVSFHIKPGRTVRNEYLFPQVS